MVTIRPVEKSDHDEWLALFSGPSSYLEFYESKLDKETIEFTFARFLDTEVPMWCVVAVDGDGRLVGFAHYLRHLDTWNMRDRIYLNDLFVKVDGRLKGIGRALIENVYAEAKAMGCFKVYWMTQFENHRAQLLYTRVGKKSGFLVYDNPNPEL
ncbi:unnamed protein product [Kuraishia capsulata CBS 1993]|uniref:N-acetyltransferase domain-containing protein n=1 Tax=Kuraishia capsulata CBS 1993 TaxID=1382522 RepID=W6MX60_9ASCO|nr:uncharacterized protein KUCA_T00004307001 [Kuraishia capsulata CBS 1993]CDK28325.1 unnamed protein product [Kuraishia capsulata CBS 1993]